MRHQSARILCVTTLLLALACACFGQAAAPLLMQKPALSQTQIVFSFAGDLWIVDRAGGDAKRMTTGAGVETDPAFSPDGKTIAFTGEYDGNQDVYVIPAAGGVPRRLTYHPDPDTVVGWTPDGKRILFLSTRNGNTPSFFYDPLWSPDSKKIAYTDKRLNLWYVDVEKAAPVKVDADTYDSPFRSLNPAWAPDSRWLTYTKQLPSHLRAVFVYGLETGKSHQITDGLSDARFAVFDKGGKYLFFTASTDIGPTTGWLDMSSYNHPVTRSAYVVVLRKDLPSPLAPESDDEKAEEPAKEAPKDTPKEPPKGDQAGATTPAKPPAKEDTTVRIDLENIDQRVLALPIPPRNYIDMGAGKAGILFLLEGPVVSGRGGPGGSTLHRFDLTTRKLEHFADDVSGGFDIEVEMEPKAVRDGHGSTTREDGRGADGGAPDEPAAHLQETGLSQLPQTALERKGT